jgi:hypothetical protein
MHCSCYPDPIVLIPSQLPQSQVPDPIIQPSLLVSNPTWLLPVPLVLILVFNNNPDGLGGPGLTMVFDGPDSETPNLRGMKVRWIN